MSAMRSYAMFFIKDGRNFADDFEKYRLRIKLGFTF